MKTESVQGLELEVINYYITKILPFMEARREITSISQEYNLQIATMPDIILALSKSEQLRSWFRQYNAFLNSNSAEYYGLRGATLNYEVWHGLGTLNGMNGLEKMSSLLESKDDSCFTKISREEWNYTVSGEIPRFHVDEIKEWKTIPTGPFIVYKPFDPNTIDFQKDSKPIDLYDLENNDKALMICGSVENIKKLEAVRAKFASRHQHYRYFLNAPNHYSFYDNLSSLPFGRPLTLFNNSTYLNRDGCFGFRGEVYGEYRNFGTGRRGSSMPDGCFLALSYSDLFETHGDEIRALVSKHLLGENKNIGLVSGLTK